MTFKVNKINTIEEYLVKDEYDYVYFFVDAQNGVLSIVSNYGSMGYRWEAPGNNFKKLDKQKKENVNLLFNRIDINEFAKDLNTTTIFSDLILYALQCNDLFKSSKILDKNIKDVTRNIKAKKKQTDRW